MGKLMTANPPNISAALRVRVQKWLFSTGEDYLTKIVEGKAVPIESPSEVTAAHMAKYSNLNIKKNVFTFEKQIKNDEFQSSFTELPID